jgi:ComF family protein
MKIYSLFPYKPPFNHIILSKFYFEQSLLTLTANIAPFLFKELERKGFFNNSVFVPIPIHWFRKFQRGFNQTEILSKRMSTLFRIPTHKILRRQKWTAFQSTLNPAARRLNVQTAFTTGANDQNLISGKKVIILDDLCTTGATLLAAGKMLLPLNPAEIIAIVICR